MSKFILIPKHVIRYGLSDMLVNLENIIAMTARDERDIPHIMFELGHKELSVKFNDNETREHFFQFILNECKPLSSAIPEGIGEPLKATDKKRRQHARD